MYDRAEYRKERLALPAKYLLWCYKPAIGINRNCAHHREGVVIHLAVRMGQGLTYADSLIRHTRHHDQTLPYQGIDTIVLNIGRGAVAGDNT